MIKETKDGLYEMIVGKENGVLFRVCRIDGIKSTLITFYKTSIDKEEARELIKRLESWLVNGTLIIDSDTKYHLYDLEHSI